MADAKQLYREIVDLERQLRELLRSNPSNAQDANALRSRLVARAQALTTAAPAIAAAKELELVLWKPCFYRRIEDFRARIRKYALAQSSDATNPHIRAHFKRVSMELQHFLQAAATFYDHARTCYSDWLDQHSESMMTSSSSSSSASVRQSLHRCFVFLGDLARYSELHSQKTKKQFDAAERLYHCALVVIPTNGNPHNQLAVLATYVENELVAVYRYVRSLLIQTPFATAEENLALLFERARQRPLTAPADAKTMTTSSVTKQQSHAMLKSLLHRLLRLHGALFRASSTSASTTARPTTATVTAVESYPLEMESAWIADLQTLLRAHAISDALLLKIVVIDIFCIVRSARARASAAGWNKDEDDAIRFAVRTVTVVIDFVHAELASAMMTSSSAEIAPHAKLLAPVSVFCDFLKLTPHVLDVLDVATNATNAARVYYVAFLESFAALVNLSVLKSFATPLLRLQNDALEPVRLQQLQLRENVELRGFAPFAALWNDSQQPIGRLHAHNDALAEVDAMRLRAWNVVRFAQFLCDELDDGNPLLFATPSGTFVTTRPTTHVGTHATNATNSFLHAVAGHSAQLQQRQPAPVANTTTPAVHNEDYDDDDDFDDEVIVFQPTAPALNPVSQSNSNSNSSSAGSASALPSWRRSSAGSTPSSTTTTSPFAPYSNSNAFGLHAPLSQSTPEQQQPPLKQRHSFSDAMFATSATSTTTNPNPHAIGSSLGYPNFQSFSSDFGGAFASTNGFLGGWGNANAANTNANALGRPPSIPKPTSYPSSFAPLSDLAAVERESALYQQETSSLSAFFSAASTSPPLTASTSTSSPFMVPPPAVPQRSSSLSSLGGGGAPQSGAVARPPPGFGGVPAAAGAAAPPTAAASPFFTRNPFINNP